MPSLLCVVQFLVIKLGKLREFQSASGGIPQVVEEELLGLGDVAWKYPVEQGIWQRLVAVDCFHLHS